MLNNPELYGIILAGGSGSRLWPLSREMYPKQLLKLTSDKTFFQLTFLRLANFISPSNIVTVTNEKHLDDIKLQIKEINDNFRSSESPRELIEPVSKNTAPAIALSVLYIKNLAENGDPIILVSPSDHIIQDQEIFDEVVKNGIKLAEAGYIVTFGIKPNKPDTGYGYISTRLDANISEISKGALKVHEFKEKPNIATAVEYVENGAHYWNSGILLFKASTLLNEIQSHSNDILQKLLQYDFDGNSVNNYKIYEELPDISIDYAVMENSKNVALLPIDCNWNDMGSWDAIFDISDRDDRNNLIVGEVVDIDSENSLIYSTSKLVSTIGLKDMVIIETEDAILACPKSRTQEVKKIYEHLKKDNNVACICHKTVYRPWGYYTVLQKGDGFLIKTIHVNPDARLSLQMHYYRSEHWVVLSGNAGVIKDEEEIYLKPGDSIDIPATTKHSLENIGDTDLEIIEIQRGSYLEEDDIVRFEDIYGRVKV